MRCSAANTNRDATGGERVVIRTATVRERPASRHAPTHVAVRERQRNDLARAQIKRTR